MIFRDKRAKKCYTKLKILFIYHKVNSFFPGKKGRCCVIRHREPPKEAWRSRMRPLFLNWLRSGSPRLLRRLAMTNEQCWAGSPTVYILSSRKNNRRLCLIMINHNPIRTARKGLHHRMFNINRHHFTIQFDIERNGNRRQRLAAF